MRWFLSKGIRVGGMLLIFGVTVLFSLYIFRESLLDFAARSAMQRFNQTISGSIEFAGITAPTFSQIEVKSIRVLAPTGHVVLELPRVRVNWMPVALFERRAAIERLEITRPFVRLAAGGENPGIRAAFASTRSTVTTLDDEPVAGLPLSILLREVRIYDARIDVDSLRVFEHIDMQASAELTPDGVLDAAASLQHLENHFHLSSHHFSVFDGVGGFDITASVGSSTLRRFGVELRSSLQCDVTGSRGSAGEPFYIRAAASAPSGESVSIASHIDPGSILKGRVRTKFSGRFPDLSTFSNLTNQKLIGSLAFEGSLDTTSGIRADGSIRSRHFSINGTPPVMANFDVTSQAAAIEFSGTIRDSKDRAATKLEVAGVTTLNKRGLELRSILSQTIATFKIDDLPIHSLELETALGQKAPNPILRGSGRWNRGVAQADFQLTEIATPLGPVATRVVLEADETKVRLSGEFKSPSQRLLKLEANTQSSIFETIWNPLARVWSIEFESSELPLEPFIASFSSIQADGAISARASVSIDHGHPTGTLNTTTTVTAKSLSSHKQTAHVDLVLHQNEATIEATIDGSVKGTLSAQLDLPSSFEKYAELELDDLLGAKAQMVFEVRDLTTLAPIPDGLQLSGSVAGDVRWQERAVHASIAGDMHLAELSQLSSRLYVRSAGDSLLFELDTEGDNGQLHTTGQLNLGSIRSWSRPPLRATGTITQVRLEALPFEWVRRSRTMGRIDGDFAVDFADRDSSGLTASAGFRLLGGIVGGVVAREGRLEFDLKQRRAKADVSLDLATAGSLQAHGIYYVENHRTQVCLTADDFSLGWLDPLLDAAQLPYRLNGRLNADLEGKLSGSKTELDGFLSLDHGHARLAENIRDLQALKIQAEVSPTASTVTAHATSGGGTIDVHAVYPAPENGQLGLVAHVEDVPVYIDRIAMSATTNLRASANISRRGVSVDGVVESGAIQVLDIDRSNLLDPGPLVDVHLGNTATTPEAERSSKPSTFPITMSLKTLEPVSVSGELIRASIVAELDTAVKSGSTTMTGYVELPQGLVRLGPHEYDLERAKLNFSGRTPVTPSFDFRLRHSFRSPDTEFFIDVSGDSADPKIRFSSQPDRYDDTQLLSFFAGGHPGQPSGSITSSTALMAAASLFTGQLQQELKKTLPVDTLELNLGEKGETASLTTGKWLSPKLYVAYSLLLNTAQSRVGPTAQSGAMLQYRISPRWMLEAVVRPGEQNTGSGDLIWSHSY